MKPEQEQMKALIEAAGECWHTGIHPLYKSVCTKCGKEFTQTAQKVHQDPTDVNDLLRLARKLLLLVRVTTVIPDYNELAYEVHIRPLRQNVWFNYGNRPTAAEALRNALYSFVQGK